MSQRCEILMTSRVTHDVKRFVLSRPNEYEFEPGMAAEIAIDRDGWRDEKRPFSFTSLPKDQVLELTVKGYPDHDGVTQAMHDLLPGDGLLLGEPWGTIRDRGPGVFIAGGAGITPLLAILRDRARAKTLDDCHLVFANKSASDVIQERELRHLLGSRATFLLDDEAGAGSGFRQGRVDLALLEELFPDAQDGRFYVCGPPPMMEAVTGHLETLGADPEAVVFEK